MKIIEEVVTLNAGVALEAVEKFIKIELT